MGLPLPAFPEDERAKAGAYKKAVKAELGVKQNVW
jgi:hypothetical protein